VKQRDAARSAAAAPVCANRVLRRWQLKPPVARSEAERSGEKQGGRCALVLRRRRHGEEGGVSLEEERW